MLLILINWLYNSFLLSIVCVVGLAVSISDKHSYFYHLPYWPILALSLVIIWIFTLIGVTSLGQNILRFFAGGRKPLKDEEERLQKVIAEVITHANFIKSINLNPIKFSVLLREGEEIPIETYGIDTIVVAPLLLTNFTDDDLKAVFAGKIAHLHYKDSLILSGILFSGVITQLLKQIYMILIRVFLNFSRSSRNIIMLLFSLLAFILLILLAPITIFCWLGDKIMKLNLAFMSQRSKYRADQFVCELGYRDELVIFLKKNELINSECSSSFWDKLFILCPNSIKRMHNIE